MENHGLHANAPLLPYKKGRNRRVAHTNIEHEIYCVSENDPTTVRAREARQEHAYAFHRNPKSAWYVCAIENDLTSTDLSRGCVHPFPFSFSTSVSSNSDSGAL